MHSEPLPSAQEKVEPPAGQAAAENSGKGVTTRIELPPDFSAPKRDRKMFIKRR